ncbi:hypothetical protein SARC_07722 [Sphaeroforma arctica JP610]|uniref:SEC23-DDH2 WWE domain-containing protein n=1 Tax=Sphaeroforma arctica JP610 TaxID=667725 RepID=A0A0L0FVD0_9EUKA|nr:hypothetical protein SARC_07722 [Sphaeroforma arctica JP610]KNC79903.1 hypothetical protein SARC_07722 [Sphaeroforma arctica JP610]|eukprot:XP_014153805.1 hypothetical protein SARC_07722 [Sphaeroforma arctica JP610]
MFKYNVSKVNELTLTLLIHTNFPLQPNPKQSGAAKVQSEPATTQTVQPSVPTTGVVFRGSFDFSQLQGDGVSDSQIQTNINSQGVDGERYMSTGSMDNAPDTATSIPPPPPMFGAPPTQAPIQTPRESTPAEAEGVYTPPEADRPSQQQPEEWLHRTSVGESEACAAAHGQTHGLANTAKQAPTNEPPATIPGTNTPAPGVPVFRGSFDFDAIHPDDPVDSAQPPPIQNDPTPATMTHASPTSMASHTRPPTQAEPPWNQSEQSLANTDAQSPQENATVAERQPQSGVPVFRGSFDFNNMQPESGENAPESTQGGATHSDSGYMTQATETHRTHSGAQADGQAPAQPGMQGFPQQQTRATMGPPPMFLPVQAGIPSMPSAAPPVPLQTPRQEVTPQQQQGMPMPGHPDTAQVPDFSAPHSEQPVSGQNEVSPPLPQQAEQTPAYLKQQVPRPGIPVFRGSFDFSAMQRDDAQGSDPVQIQGESGPISESEYTAAHGTTLGGQQQALPVVHMAQVDQQQQQQQHQQDQQQPPQQGLSESQAQAQMGSTSLPGVAAFRGSLDLNAMREDMDSTPTTDTHPEHTSQTHPQPAQHPPASTIGQPVFRGSFDFTQMQNDTDAPGESSQAAAPTPEPSQERSQFYNPNAYTAPQQPSAFDAMAAPGNTINNYQSDVPYDQGVGISTVPTGRGSLNFNKMQSNEDPQAAFSPPATHWFYKHYETKGWTAFSILDNDALEKAHHESVAASAITGDVVVPVNGGRYDAFLSKRKMQAVYWMEDAMEIARCSWMKKHMNGAMKPYPEEVGELLEREYTQAYRTDTWNRRIVTPAGDLVVMFSPTVAVHYNKSEAAAIEIYGHQDNSGESPKEPFMAVRGFDSIVFDAGEGPPDHLYLVVHGIGNKVDLKQRDLVQATRSMRTSSRRLRKNALDEGGDPVPVAEYLPIMWHSSLHSNTGVDAKINGMLSLAVRES